MTEHHGTVRDCFRGVIILCNNSVHIYLLSKLDILSAVISFRFIVHTSLCTFVLIMILTGNPLHPSLGSHFSTCSTKQTGTMCSECFSAFISQIVLCLASSMLLVLFYLHGKTEADRRYQDRRIISELITKICSDVRSGLHEFMGARHSENFSRVWCFLASVVLWTVNS